MSAFEDLGMMEELAVAVRDMGWTLPTDIQSEGIPAILGGGDVLMAAETGSGKTGAFCLPMLQVVHESMSQKARPPPTSSTGSTHIADAWRMSIYDRDNGLNVDNSGLLVESQHPRLWSGVRAERGVKANGGGRFYYEARIDSDGLCRMGWATADAALNLGTDAEGYGFGGTGKKSNAGNFDDYGESFTNQDVIGCYLDLTGTGNVHWAKNGHQFPTAFRLPQALMQSGKPIYPAVVIKNARLRLNFGDSPDTPLQYPSPVNSGYVPIGSAPSSQVVSSSSDSHRSRSHEQSSDSGPKRRPNKAPLCIILEPTKELAQQTYDQIEKFKRFLKEPSIRNALAAGGISIGEQMDAIERGVDIITCTTGRLMALVHEGRLQLDYVRFFVVDEADSLCGNSDSARCISESHRRIPKYSRETGERLQMIVCSATLHNADVKRLADTYMHFPQWVDLKGQDVVPDSVHQVVCMVDPREDMSWIRVRSKTGEAIQTDGVHQQDVIRPGGNSPETLSEAVKILKAQYVLAAIEAHSMQQAIIFCRTKLDCDHLEAFLNRRGYTCLCLHGDRDPAERARNLQKFKEGAISFLIATDVAARGLDVRGVPYVINVTLPPAEEKANYVHRIGRVGRAERMGLAISLVSSVVEKVWYHKCKSRGTSCNNTQLVNRGGCCLWYNEVNYLSEIEEHLGVTISRVGNDFLVPQFEYEGRVVYGSKRTQQSGPNYSHAVELKATVQTLADLEKDVQLAYLANLAG